MPAKYGRSSVMRGRRGGRSKPRGGRPPPSGTPYQSPKPGSPPSSPTPPPLPPRPPAGPPPTPYAKKYGFLPSTRDPIDFFSKFSKSGYTPTDPVTIIRGTKEEGIRRRQEDEFQRVFLLRGFNARELSDMGAYPDGNVGGCVSILSNPVLPIFRLDHWEMQINRLQDDRVISKIDAKGEQYDFGEWDPGSWVAANPIVWAVLEPVLKLVGRYLDSMHTSAWLDAYLCGPRKELPPHLDGRTAAAKAASGLPLYTFGFRSPTDQDQAEILQLKQKFMEQLEKQVTFGFGNRKNNASTNRPWKKQDKTMNWDGVTSIPEPGDFVASCFASSLLQPLLRNDLNASERFTEQWHCAAVMLHEFAHVIRGSETLALINTLPIQQLDTIELDEPYMEGEIFAELGYSFEQHLHGGEPKAFIRDMNQDTPHLGLFIESFPTRNSTASIDLPFIGGRTALPKQDYYKPIPAKHLENMYHDEFWDYAVRKWGIAMVKPENEIVSIAADSQKKGIDNYVQVLQPFQSPFRSDLDQVLDAKNQELQNAIALNREEREAYIIAERLAQAERKVKERVKFWRTRWEVSIEILKAKEEHEAIWHAVDLVNLVPAQRKLLDLYVQEGRDQAAETLAFKESGVVDERHKSLLMRVNRYLRTLMNDFGNSAKYAWQLQFLKEADELNTMLNITFMILVGRYSGVQDPEITIAEEEKKLNAEAAALEIVSDQADKLLEDSEIATTLNLGIQAAVDNNQARCYSLGHFLFTMFPAKPLVRNIGLILMAHDESQQLRSNLCKMGVQRLEDLQTSTPEEENARLYWLDGGRAMLARMSDEKQDLIAPCIKRRRSYGSSIDDALTEEGDSSSCTPQ